MTRKLIQHRGRRGFTLIELLIVVAIIGIIAAILIPNLLDALQKAKQKRTVGDIRSVGEAWFNWLTDQVSASAAGASGNDFVWDFPQILDGGGLLETLYTDPADGVFYIQQVPTRDGWGTAYEYGYNNDVLTAARYLGIRSAGRPEGSTTFDGTTYVTGPFNATDYAQDIVWSDGFFVRYPAGAKVR